jgi:hypothetical protein
MYFWKHFFNEKCLKYFALKFCLFVDRHVFEKCEKSYKSIPELKDYQVRDHEMTRYTCAGADPGFQVRRGALKTIVSMQSIFCLCQ